MSKNAVSVLPIDSVVSKIYLIRGKRVMLDSDLSELYGVKTKFINLAVKRNKPRFYTERFMRFLMRPRRFNLRNADKGDLRAT